MGHGWLTITVSASRTAVTGIATTDTGRSTGMTLWSTATARSSRTCSGCSSSGCGRSSGQIRIGIDGNQLAIGATVLLCLCLWLTRSLTEGCK